MYASCEKDNEYYRHPILEPDLLFGFIDLLKFITSQIVSFIFSPLVIVWVYYSIVTRTDSLNVFIDSGKDVNKKKKWWKFWRWGLNYVPKSSSPLH
jgi:hypothetical protein